MKKGIQIVLALVILGLVYVIAMEIHTPQAFNKELKQRNAAVIERLEDIRTAERAFKKKYQYFTGSFDTLINFVLTDTLEMERRRGRFSCNGSAQEGRQEEYREVQHRSHRYHLLTPQALA